MKPLYVTSDLHLSTIRSGGTTPATAVKLRRDLLQGFSDILDRCDSDILINGDFADSYQMVAADMLASYNLMSSWLIKGGHRIWAIPGNHCLSKSSENLSSFEFLFRLLSAQFPEQVTLMMQPGPVRDGMYALGHVQNQDILDAEMEKVPEGTYLFLHANYDNKFAVNSDHSLNITAKQCIAAPVSNVIFGHEHVRREALKGKVRVCGNPFPSSVSDCLHNTEKFMLKLTDSGIEYITTWQAEGDFDQQDWRSLKDTGARFIRVVGTATADEASDAVAAISRFRSISEALVITNAIAVGDALDASQLAINAETVTAFDVKSALFEILEPEEVSVIKSLLGE
jgi:metallophosphoesterase superfamily enzyme